MIPTIAFQARRNRQFLLLVTVLLTGWALRLIHQSQTYVPASYPEPEISDLLRKRSDLLKIRESSLLPLFYRELDVEVTPLDPTGAEIPNPIDVVMILHPRTQAPGLLAALLADHVCQGGRLIVVSRDAFDLLARFGLQTRELSGPAWDRRFATTRGATVEGAHADRTEFEQVRHIVSSDRPMVPLLVGSEGEVIAGMIGHGSGTVVALLGDPDRLDDVLRADNPVFLANLVLGGTSAARAELEAGGGRPRGFRNRDPRSGLMASLAVRPGVRVVDLDPDILTALYDLEAVRARREREARDLWNYDSLWSLVMANPVCAALLQLFLALAVFACARARRLGEVLPDRLEPGEGHPGVVPGWAAYLERHRAVGRAVQHALQFQIRRLARTLGLPAGSNRLEILEALAERSPKARGLMTRLEAIARNRTVIEGTDPATLVEVWKLIVQIDREVGRR